MKKYIFLLTLVSLTPLFGCSSAQHLNGEENKITKNGISVSATSVANKKNKYFVDFVLLNDSEKPVIFKLKKAQ